MGAGCLVYGCMTVNKVSGNIHIAIGQSKKQRTSHIHSFTAEDLRVFNCSHTINSLTFGKEYPGMVDPLMGSTAIVNDNQALVQYFISVVPTVYKSLNGDELYTNQYSVNKKHHDLDLLHSKHDHSHTDSGKLPGVFFIYDLSPFLVEVVQTKIGVGRLFVSLCAITGGVFTITGIVNSCLFTAQNSLTC
jgi:hypothetical protein